MSNFKFIEYIPTPQAKQEGVAYISVNADGVGEIMLGFKVVMKKDGTGRFVADPSWKLELPGQEEWKQWIVIDSNISKQQLHSLIKEGVHEYESRTKNKAQQGDFGVTSGQSTNGQQKTQQSQSNDENSDLPF